MTKCISALQCRITAASVASLRDDISDYSQEKVHAHIDSRQKFRASFTHEHPEYDEVLNDYNKRLEEIEKDETTFQHNHPQNVHSAHIPDTITDLNQQYKHATQPVQSSKQQQEQEQYSTVTNHTSNILPEQSVTPSQNENTYHHNAHVHQHQPHQTQLPLDIVHQVSDHPSQQISPSTHPNQEQMRQSSTRSQHEQEPSSTSQQELTSRATKEKSESVTQDTMTTTPTISVEETQKFENINIPHAPVPLSESGPMQSKAEQKRKEPMAIDPLIATVETIMNDVSETVLTSNEVKVSIVQTTSTTTISTMDSNIDHRTDNDIYLPNATHNQTTKEGERKTDQQDDIERSKSLNNTASETVLTSNEVEVPTVQTTSATTISTMDSNIDHRTDNDIYLPNATHNQTTKEGERKTDQQDDIERSKSLNNTASETVLTSNEVEVPTVQTTSATTISTMDSNIDHRTDNDIYLPNATHNQTTKEGERKTDQQDDIERSKSLNIHTHHGRIETLLTEQLEHNDEQFQRYSDEKLVHKRSVDILSQEKNHSEVNNTVFQEQDVTKLPKTNVSDTTNDILSSIKQETIEESIEEKNIVDDKLLANTTTATLLTNSHLPRVNDETVEENNTLLTTIQTLLVDHEQNISSNANETSDDYYVINSTEQTSETLNENITHLAKMADVNDSILLPSILTTTPSSIIDPIQHDITRVFNRQICWQLPAAFEPSMQLIENEILKGISMLPEFIQTLCYSHDQNKETMWNKLWFFFITILCIIFGLIFLSIAYKRLLQNKQDIELRIRCQALQQRCNQVELELETYERQCQKLEEEIDDTKNQTVKDSDEDLFQLRNELDCVSMNLDTVSQDNEIKVQQITELSYKHQKNLEIINQLNEQLFTLKNDLEKKQSIILRLESTDLTLERFEKLQETINQLRHDMNQLKQEKSLLNNKYDQLVEKSNKNEIENTELTTKMKQLRTIIIERDNIIQIIKDKIMNRTKVMKQKNVDENDDVNEDDDEDEDEQEEQKSDFISLNEILVTCSQINLMDTMLNDIDMDVEKASKHVQELNDDIEQRNKHVKELDMQLHQEKERCKELETKLKVVLELRERDAHLHIRQLGQTDAELRKARTDGDRVRILQQQLELKQQQLDDVQKLAQQDQNKLNEERSKHERSNHENWFEIKKLTRELDAMKKECEDLRRQNAKYANNERISQEKIMKPVAQHVNNHTYNDMELNGNTISPPLNYPSDHFRTIDQARDSGTLSPADMFRMTRPPMFGPPRPPFFPPFMPPHPYTMGARFPMGPNHLMPGGFISPISQIMTNGHGIGSEENCGESTNITPNSIIYDNSQVSSLHGINDQNTLSSTMYPSQSSDYGENQTKDKSKKQKKISKDDKDKKKKSKKTKDLDTTQPM
ncbi:unnamed protein product [Didymodactylos carnosus]|uniref:Uncharacterized protein n=1 Tax=Didymodactylos carnosus TaxID=1234261 RepID=A0A813SUA8_9BILA|nr:unnamed protein product [Didymodactylos carnosus]